MDLTQPAQPAAEDRGLLDAVTITRDGAETVIDIKLATQVRIPDNVMNDPPGIMVGCGKIIGEMVAERAKLDIDLDLIPAIATKVDEHFKANPLPAA